jgi:hypothetical protein
MDHHDVTHDVWTLSPSSSTSPPLRLGGAAIACQRRLLRREGEPPASPTPRSSSRTSTPTAASGWTAGRPAAARRPARLGHHPPRPPRRGPRRRGRHRLLPRQLPGTAPSRPARRPPDARRAIAPDPDASGRAAPEVAAQGRHEEPLRDRRRPALHPRAPQHLPRRRRGPPARARRGPCPTGAASATAGEVDLAAARTAAVLACSDMFFGERHNLIMPGRAPTWATAGRPAAAAAPATTGPSSASAPAARSASRARHQPLQGQLPRHGREVCDASAEARLADERPGASCSRARSSRPHTRHLFEDELACHRRGHATCA